MLWIGIALLASLAMVPLAYTLTSPADPRGRRESALALHRAQLAELGRDLAEGRIAASEHGAAVLEVQRRMLAVAGTSESRFLRGARGPVIAALFVVPAASLLLYLAGGSPGLPAAPLQARIAASEQQAREESALIDKLRQILARLDPHTEKAREGYILLGGAEARLGDMKDAAEAWKTALATRFDPVLAMEAAEATTEANGRVTKEAADLFRHALATAPPDAPWRQMVQKRLAQEENLPPASK